MLQLTIAGNVGKEPELRQAGASDVLSFSVAVTTRLKGGEKGTQWVDVSLFGARGAALQPHIHKGTKIAVTGSMALREYTSGGEKRISLDLVADNVTLMDPAPSQGGGTTGGGGGYAGAGAGLGGGRGRY